MPSLPDARSGSSASLKRCQSASRRLWRHVLEVEVRLARVGGSSARRSGGSTLGRRRVPGEEPERLHVQREVRRRARRPSSAPSARAGSRSTRCRPRRAGTASRRSAGGPRGADALRDRTSSRRPSDLSLQDAVPTKTFIECPGRLHGGIVVLSTSPHLHRQDTLRADRAPRRERRGDGSRARRRPRTAPPDEPQAGAGSIVQWKLCGLTTFTSTTLTAMPEHEAEQRADRGPDRAFGRDDGERPGARVKPEVREQAELLAPRQHLRREARGDAEQADRDRHRLQPVGDGEAAVEDAQRDGADLARRGEFEQRLAGQLAARVAAASARSCAPHCACSRRREPERDVVDAPVAAQRASRRASIAIAPCWRA